MVSKRSAQQIPQRADNMLHFNCIFCEVMLQRALELQRSHLHLLPLRCYTHTVGRQEVQHQESTDK
jgi:hypothetical protein